MKRWIQDKKLTNAGLAIRRQSFLITVASAEKASVRVLANFCAAPIVNRTLIDICTDVCKIISAFMREKQREDGTKYTNEEYRSYFTFTFRHLAIYK